MTTIVRGPGVPLRSWMMFVDGENFAIRAKEIADRHSVSLKQGERYQPDVFVWIPGHHGSQPLTVGSIGLQPQSIRSYYYTSVVGDIPLRVFVQKRLHHLGFTPVVFKRPRGNTRSKGVDISLATDVLGHAHRGNYEVAVLVAGDGDYVPLVNEVKRLGKIVYVAFFGGSTGLNKDLPLASDGFFDIEEYFIDRWRTDGQ